MNGTALVVLGCLLAAACALAEPAQDKPAGPGSRGMSYTIDDILEGVLPRLDTLAAEWKAMGGTSIQTYVTWETCERAGDRQWDWSAWDTAVATLRKHDLKWIPFLIAGPAYATPKWYRSGPDHAPAICLEHGTASDIQSLWSPYIKAHVDRFLKAFAERYRDTGVLESINLGIQGDYGEAIYPVQGGWTGDYHQHPGFWCGDAYALADFRRWSERRYGSIGLLNRAWGTQFERFEQVDYPARGAALAEFISSVPNGTPAQKRRWLDFVEWYRHSMTDLAEWWVRTARRHFPQTPIYLCTGGDAVPAHGSHFADQCRVAAAYGAGIRITNEGSDMCGNFMLTRWVASAGRHYGAYFGFEPAALEDELGAVARIFNATTSGAVQLADKHYNTVTKPAQRQVIEANLHHLFAVRRPVVHVALWYPNVSLTLENKSITQIPDAYLLRRLTDMDYIDESLLRAGALDRYPILVMVHGQVIEAGDALRLAEWVQAGGHLLLMNMPALQTVEGADVPEQLLFGDTPSGRQLGAGHVERVSSLAELAPRLQAVLRARGLPVVEQQYRGQVYASQIAPDRWLVFNADREHPGAVRITTSSGERIFDVPPASILDTQ